MCLIRKLLLVSFIRRDSSTRLRVFTFVTHLAQIGYVNHLWIVGERMAAYRNRAIKSGLTAASNKAAESGSAERLRNADI
jgi:hypothetical protein